MIDQNHDDKTVRKEDAARPGEDATQKLPEKIGRYRVIRLLGQGGFGRVYLAHDDDLKRPVAIKVPNPERISRPEDIEAYLNEARILASLDHPHIVPVYDVGRTDDGSCYVVSKYIEGSNLATRIREDAPVSVNRRNWWPQSPKPCTTPTPEGWSTGTSSPPTS